MDNTFNKDFGDGLGFQDYVFQKLWDKGIGFLTFSSKEYQKVKGDGLAVEVKLDRYYHKTNRFFIETEYQYKEGWNDSGIYKGSPIFLAIGDYDVFYLFSILQLKKYGAKQEKITINNGTAKGFFIEQDIIEKLKLLEV